MGLQPKHHSIMQLDQTTLLSWVLADWQSDGQPDPCRGNGHDCCVSAKLCKHTSSRGLLTLGTGLSSRVWKQVIHCAKGLGRSR